ncbi:MAG: hypothetical protein OXI58_01530 [Gemmatimonadota bacterium]|nr:hypothetical protein [Gemmatimonadota bacterium]
MTSPALLMLLERLLWPVPRVRWEAGRSLAYLIREGDREAANGLLNWISARRLESEAVLGLGIIDAFDLGAYFEFTDVSEAVRVPSHLSDCLLKKNFTDARSLSPFRYAISPPEPATLPQDQEAWFDRYRKSAVPPMFSRELRLLQEVTGFPFRVRWEHDWRWLQATDPRPKADYPRFFSSADRDRVGQFDLGQRELYVSAYLRTLAYFAIRGSMPHHVAEDCAQLALTMNRGLAALEPVARPDWARNLLPFDAGRTKEIAQKLWTNAGAATSLGEVPLSLRVIDFDRKGFVEFDLALAIGPSGFTAGPAETETLDLLIVNERSGAMAGLVGRDAGTDSLSIEPPLIMTQDVLPKYIGRAHTDMVLNIRLASPYVFGTSANVQCGPSEIRLEAGSEVLSRWVHWYADWEPTTFPELESAVGSMTTVLKSRLDQLRAFHGVEIARLVRVRRGVRQEIYEEHKVATESYWA